MRLTTRSLAPAVVCLGLFAMVGATAVAQTDPQVGVWKLNVAKSKYSPGPAPTSATTTIEAAGAGTKVTVDQAMADGTKRHYTFTTSYDGKDAPVVGRQSRCRYRGAHAHQRLHRADDFEESRQGDDYADVRGVERRQDQDRHDQGRQCERGRP